MVFNCLIVRWMNIVKENVNIEGVNGCNREMAFKS
jgi:hypothetical protein